MLRNYCYAHSPNSVLQIAVAHLHFQQLKVHWKKRSLKQVDHLNLQLEAHLIGKLIRATNTRLSTAEHAHHALRNAHCHFVHKS